MRTKLFAKIALICIALAAVLIWSAAVAVAAEAPKYGGKLIVLGLYPGLSPMNWDQADWGWKHGNDTGLAIEHLLMGDLQKGPRGTNEYGFTADAWIPPRVTTGELAESWEIEKDPLAIVFHLRKGVYWQEKPGVMKRREFTADDVVASMTRLAGARKAIPTYVSFIEKWVARDKYTAVAVLNEWNANWPYRIGWGYYDGIQAPEQAVAGARDWKNLCGTGPYMVTDVKSGHHVIWTKNKDYWGSEVISGKKYQLPFTDEIVNMLIPDVSARVASLRTGKVDLMMGISKSDMDSLRKSTPDLKWAERPISGGYPLALRMDTKPFDDIRVRRALNLAVNQQEIINSVYEGEGNLNFYPFPFYFKEVFTPIEEMPETARELFSYNPEKAKKLLAEAGYPNGFTFKAQVIGTSNMDVESLVVAYLAKVGVTLELDPLAYPSYVSMMYKKTHGPGYFFSNDHGNPYACIRKNFVSGQTWNPYMMKDKHVDDVFFSTIKDPNLSTEEGFGRMKDLAVYVIDQAPAVWLPGRYVYAAWWPWVKNYYGEMRIGANRPSQIWARIWIDQDLKKKMGY